MPAKSSNLLAYQGFVELDAEPDVGVIDDPADDPAGFGGVVLLLAVFPTAMFSSVSRASFSMAALVWFAWACLFLKSSSASCCALLDLLNQVIFNSSAT
jgi:hypothetical protein